MSNDKDTHAENARLRQRIAQLESGKAAEAAIRVRSIKHGAELARENEQLCQRVAELEKEREHLKIDARLRVQAMGETVLENQRLQAQIDTAHAALNREVDTPLLRRVEQIDNWIGRHLDAEADEFDRTRKELRDEIAALREAVLAVASVAEALGYNYETVPLVAMHDAIDKLKDGD